MEGIYEYLIEFSDDSINELSRIEQQIYKDDIIDEVLLEV